MKIAFDSRWSGSHGIGRFAAEVRRRLQIDSDIDTGPKPSSPLDPIFLTARLLFCRNLYIFSPGYNIPLLFHNRYLFTVHDLIHIDVKENSSFLKRAYYKYILRRACRLSRRILTVSEYTRQRLSSWAGIPVSNIDVVGNGVSAAFTSSAKPLDVPFRYFLCVSNRRPHKNENSVLRAFASLEFQEDVRLVFTGERDKNLGRLVNELGLSERVIFTGPLTESRLASWYKSAISLVFPSSYEGFGLPVVEAMACGTPVVTSNTTSLPEVAGSAALLVSPNSIDDISEAMERFYCDESLRDQFIRMGLEQAKKYSWDSVACRVMESIEKTFPHPQANH